MECWQIVHILCRLGRARDPQAEMPDKAGAPCQIELTFAIHRAAPRSSPKHGALHIVW